MMLIPILPGERTTESPRLEKTFKITRFNNQPDLMNTSEWSIYLPGEPHSAYQTLSSCILVQTSHRCIAGHDKCLRFIRKRKEEGSKESLPPSLQHPSCPVSLSPTTHLLPSAAWHHLSPIQQTSPTERRSKTTLES